MIIKNKLPCINIIRGDTEKLAFKRRDYNGEVIMEKAKEIFFTVKNNANTVDFLFQKTIDDMEFDTETGKYTFLINPDDTNNLKYDTYKYDLEVKDTDYKKTISFGDFRVLDEITFVENEG